MIQRQSSPQADRPAVVGVGQQSEGGGHDRRGERRDRGAVSVHVAWDHLPQWQFE